MRPHTSTATSTVACARVLMADITIASVLSLLSIKLLSNNHELIWCSFDWVIGKVPMFENPVTVNIRCDDADVTMFSSSRTKIWNKLRFQIDNTCLTLQYVFN